MRRDEEDPTTDVGGGSTSSMERTEDEKGPTTAKIAGIAAVGTLLIGGGALLIVSALTEGGDTSTSTLAQPDNQLFGGSAFGTSKLRKSYSEASLSVRLPGPEEVNLEVVNTSTPEPVPYSSSQCLITPNGWTVSALEEEDPLYPAVEAIIPDWTGYTDVAFGLEQPFNRTFDVMPNHTVLDNGEGVIFNIETVPEALPQDVRKPRLSREEIRASVEKEAGLYYQRSSYSPNQTPPNVRLEALSDIAKGNLVFAGGQGFVASAMMAFAYHLPLALTPDHLWAVITSGFAYHVNQYPEELRYNFVNHSDKIDLVVREDSLLMGQTPPAQWEELVFPRFKEEVGKNMNNTDVYDLLVQTKFSTTTPTSQAASEIVLMATLKAYFRYTLVTMCGIPQIKLEGTRDDWQRLRDRTAQLAQWMMPNHTQGDLWIRDVMLPILDEFLRSYDGEPNYCFWQTMVKFRLNRDGCDSFDFLSGWLPTLFPYLDSSGSIQANRYLRHWSESSMGDHRGPDPSQIPIQMASAPVTWDYYHVDYPIHFHAGFRGVNQMEGDIGMLRPVLGWYITHDP